MSTVSSSRVFEYLEGLPGTTFRKLYHQPSTALAIFRRMLPHLAKSFVMAMLYAPHPLKAEELDQWVRPDGQREKDHTLMLLQRLHILEAGPVHAPHVLNKEFATALRLALTGGGSHQSFGVPCESADKYPVDVAFLDQFARAQWEGILHYMVGSTGAELQGAGATGPSPGVKKLMELGGLIKRGQITQEGFSFLLQEVNAQVWALLIFYLQNAEGLNMDEIEILSFLFMLGSLTLGQDYSISTLSETQISMLSDLRDFGIIYQRKANSRRFYPTRLATTLTSDAGALRPVAAGFDNALRSSDGKGFIVIETNYRLYAYTSSPLQIAVLGLFTKLSTRYPNMVSGRVTRESIRRAIALGITSDQIISYLTTHAHPQLAKTLPVLPPTVVDQIRLWQIEGERMKATQGFLFRDFASREEYEAAARYADEVGVLVQRFDRSMRFFVTRHEQMAAFIKARKAKAG